MPFAGAILCIFLLALIVELDWLNWKLYWTFNANNSQQRKDQKEKNKNFVNAHAQRHLLRKGILTW